MNHIKCVKRNKCIIYILLFIFIIQFIFIDSTHGLFAKGNDFEIEYEMESGYIYYHTFNRDNNVVYYKINTNFTGVANFVFDKNDFYCDFNLYDSNYNKLSEEFLYDDKAYLSYILKPGTYYIGISVNYYYGTKKLTTSYNFKRLQENLEYKPGIIGNKYFDENGIYRGRNVTRSKDKNGERIDFVACGNLDTQYTNNWIRIDGILYYLDSTRTIDKNCFREGYWLDSQGKINTTYAKGVWESNSTGWWYRSGPWYPKNQWCKIDGKYYYFNSDGYMEKGCVCNGYILNTDGSWNSSYSKGSWHKDNIGWWYGGNDGWYLYNGWNKVDDVWYFFSGNGYIYTNCYVDGFWLGSDGACK